MCGLQLNSPLFVSEESVHILPAVEDFELVHALANADVVYGDAELVANTDNHTTFGRAVQLGDGKRINLGGQKN